MRCFCVVQKQKGVADAMIEADHVMRQFIFRDRSTNDRTAVKSVIQWFQRNKSASSVGEVILDARRYKRLTFYLPIICSILWCASYLILIYPVFLLSDLTNPAVANFIASDAFQELNERASLELDGIARTDIVPSWAHSASRELRLERGPAASARRLQENVRRS